MLTLRLYQQEAVDVIYRHLRERDDNPCVALPTGTGKGVIIGQIATDATEKWNGRVIVLAHVKELLEQNADKIRKLCPDLDVGIYSAGLNSRDTEHAVIVAGIQSVYKRACELGAFDLAVVDEAHLIPEDGEGMYRTFLNDARTINPNLRIIGLTATPFRLKGGLICKQENILNHVCYEAGIKEMIVQGYLSPLKTRGGKVKANLDDLHLRGGEFIASEIEEAMDRSTLVHAACEEIVKLTRDRRTVLIFTSGVLHCQHVAAEIQRISGEECGGVTGETPSNERAELLARFKGESVANGLFDKKPPLKYLANVNVLTTGFDATNVDCVVLLRPTNSPGLYVQMIGRGTRMHPGKDDCLILDYGGNVIRHGPVDAIRIDDQGMNGKGEAPAKECPNCQLIIAAGYTVCPDCGYEFPQREEAQHDGKASTAGILSGDVSVTEYQVEAASYHVHSKRGAKEDAPKTMRAEYQIGWRSYHSEWICFEHTGWARQKAESWWRRRSNAPVPMSSAEAEILADDGALCETKAITIRSVTDEKYDRIVGYELGDKPAWREPGCDDIGETEKEPVYSSIDEFEVPF